MMDTNVSYTGARLARMNRIKEIMVTNLSLFVEKLKTKCKELIFKACRALEKPGGYQWVVSMMFEGGVVYQALVSMPTRSTEREIVLRWRIRSLQVARMQRWERADRATRKQMLLKRINEILAVNPDYAELKTLKSLVRYAK